MKPSSDVISRRVDEEIVLVNLKTNRIYSLNPTGTRLWELLEGGMQRSEIEARLVEEFAVDRSALKTEIDSLVASLIEAELVEISRD